MSIAKKSETGKGNSYAADSLLDMAGKMGQWICEAAAEGRAFHEFESEWHEMIHRMANLGRGVFISLQGDGPREIPPTIGEVIRKSITTMGKTPAYAAADQLHVTN